MMNKPIKNIAFILREFIKAHIERGDCDAQQRYIPRLTQLVEEMERGEFQKQPKEMQIATLRALRGEYLGRGEVFWQLAPKHLELEYEQALVRAIMEYVDDLQSQ